MSSLRLLIIAPKAYQLNFLFFTSFFILLTIAGNCQNIEISAVVKDASSDESLAFANIMLLNNAIGTSADSKGFFNLILEDSLRDDSIIVSYVGYHKRRIAVKDLKSGMVQLQARDYHLNEVTIKPSDYKRKNLVLNRFKLRKCFVRQSPAAADSTNFYPQRAEEPSIEALYFPFKEEYTEIRQLKEVSLKVSNFKSPPCFFILHIFMVSDNYSPGEDMLSQPIVVEVSDTRKPISITLEEYNLSIPDNGFFIGFELLIIEENRIDFEIDSGNICAVYSPFLNFYESKEETSFWVLTEGGWKEKTQVRPPLFKLDKEAYFKPAISVILTN